MEALRKFGPYVATEVLLPGGTLIALLLYLCSQGMSIRRAAVRLLSTGKE